MNTQPFSQTDHLFSQIMDAKYDVIFDVPIFVRI